MTFKIYVNHSFLFFLLVISYSSQYLILPFKILKNHTDSSILYSNALLDDHLYNPLLINISISGPNNYLCAFLDTNTDKLWYQTSTSNFICIEGDCPDNFPVYVESTKQCLTSCKGTHYPNLFESKCYSDCLSTGIANVVQMEITSDLASFKCDCPLPWYYDSDNKMVCPPNDGSIKRCKDHNKGLDFMIDETRQCVKECPSEYPYYFNNKCYKSCEEANEKYELNIELKESSFECVCQNLWYIDPNDSYEKDKICYRKDINE
jgi:hypothetical protein